MAKKNNEQRIIDIEEKIVWIMDWTITRLDGKNIQNPILVVNHLEKLKKELEEL